MYVNPTNKEPYCVLFESNLNHVHDWIILIDRNSSSSNSTKMGQNIVFMDAISMCNVSFLRIGNDRRAKTNEDLLSVASVRNLVEIWKWILFYLNQWSLANSFVWTNVYNEKFSWKKQMDNGLCFEISAEEEVMFLITLAQLSFYYFYEYLMRTDWIDPALNSCLRAMPSLSVTFVHFSIQSFHSIGKW